MKHFWKINLYEIQAILYWILGVVILNVGTMKFVGWFVIVYGWLTFAFALIYAGKHATEIKKEFE